MSPNQTEDKVTPHDTVTSELDHRKTAILNAVVAEYIDSASPVGSGHIASVPGVEVSSATVRSEMAALEREGFLVQPHTSAGRIPTDKGYRFFVDSLGSTGNLTPDQRRNVGDFFRDVHGEVEEMLGRTSRLLSSLTDCAGVVVGPNHTSSTVRSVQLVGLSSRVALVLVVLADGSVEKATVETADGATPDQLALSSAHLTAELQDKTLLAAGLLKTGRATTDPVVADLVRIGFDTVRSMAAHEEHEHVFVGGSSRVASAFEAVETVRSVLSILEQQLVVVELVEDVLERGLSVAIGAEHGFEPLSACALVVSPLAVDGDGIGTIAVLGPTRMDYPRALAAVKAVGDRLAGHLSGRPVDGGDGHGS